MDHVYFNMEQTKTTCSPASMPPSSQSASFYSFAADTTAAAAAAPAAAAASTPSSTQNSTPAAPASLYHVSMSAQHTASLPVQSSPNTSMDDIVSMAEKMEICQYYASLNNNPTTASFNALHQKLRLQNISIPNLSASQTATIPTSAPLAAATTSPWSSTLATKAVADAFEGITCNGGRPSSAAHLLRLRAEEKENHTPHQQHRHHNESEYIRALQLARSKLKNAMRARIRHAVRGGCIKRASLDKSTSSVSPKSSRATISSTRTPMAAVATSSIATSTDISSSSPVALVTNHSSLEERIQLVFTAHRFLLRESQQLLHQVQMATETAISPITSDDEMAEMAHQRASSASLTAIATSSATAIPASPGAADRGTSRAIISASV